MVRRPLLLLVTVFLAGCRTAPPPAPQYIVTAAPLKVIDPAHPGLCIAVDPNDPKGIWWWDAGRSGCSTSSSSTMAAHEAHVTTSATGVTVGSFRVGLVSNETRAVSLEISGGRIRDALTGLVVPAERRQSLDVPLLPPRRRGGV